MEEQFTSTLDKIRSAVETQNEVSANKLIVDIGAYFDGNVSDSVSELRLEKIFSEDTGLLELQKSNKSSKGTNAKLFKLYDEIINNQRYNLAPYAERIINVSYQCIISTKPTANEKENATMVIQSLVKAGLCANMDSAELIKNTLSVLSNVKAPIRLSGKLYELNGLIASQCGDMTLRIHVLESFLKKLEEANVNATILTGVLHGLEALLNTLSGRTLANWDEFLHRIYLCVKKIADLPTGVRIRVVHRTALDMMQNRMHLFGEFVLDDFRYWHELLWNKWLPLPMPDQENAICFLEAFFDKISYLLSGDILINAGKIRPPLSYREAMEFFIEHFKVTLQLSESKHYEVRLALRGIRAMAEPCKKHLPLDQLQQLLMLMVQRIQYVTNALLAGCVDHLVNLPNYAQTLSQIMKYVNGLSAESLDVLRELIVVMIRHFHLVPIAHQSFTLVGLMKTFENVMRSGDTFLDDMLKRIVREGVVLTIDATSVGVCAGKGQNYKSYLPLWNGLLSRTYSTPSSKIYDHMMDTLFTIIDKLDLTTRKRIHRDSAGNDLELYFCDPNYDLEPNRPRDFASFFNLVDLYCDLLSAPSQNFRKWQNQYVEIMIRKSIEYPLVSGFLKLIQIALDFIKQTDNVFVKRDTNPSLDAQMGHFLRKTISRAKQTSGELQISCLTLLFSAPVIMLKEFSNDLIPAFLIAFEIGKSNVNISIADQAFSAMEHCVGATHLTFEEKESILHDVLPSLEPYLRGTSYEAAEHVSSQANRWNGPIGTKLSKFQRRIVSFLGNLEPDRCLHLLRKNHDQLNLVKWNDFENVVCLDLFGGTSRLRLCLDAMLPQICELACASTDRQKKMSACELLHAILLYVLGTHEYKGKLWTELCSRMLLLGCDADGAVRQMFEPLIWQTMHYMSHKDRIHHDGVDILLQCQLEALSHRTNSALRQLAARSLREYLVWAIKQTSIEQMLAAPISVTTLIGKIKLFCLDSAHEKRFAAALAFNNLYRELREEQSIVDSLWLELFYVFCMNFVMCEEYSDRNVHSQPDLEQVSVSLDHLVRVFCELKHVFNAPNPQQRIPVAAFGGDQLKHVVRWLFRQCGISKPNYRRKAMAMFSELAKCVDGHDSASSFVRDPDIVGTIMEVCVGSPDGKGIAGRPDLRHIDKTNRPLSGIREWLESVHASLDCSFWLINEKLVAIAELFDGNNVLLKVVGYFMNNVFRANENEMLELIDVDAMQIDEEDGIAQEQQLNLRIDIEEAERIASLKCTILLRIYELMVKALTAYMEISLHWSLDESFFHILIDGLFEPQSIGFESKDTRMRAKLAKCTESLIVAIHRHAPTEYKCIINELLSKTVIEHYECCENNAQSILGLNEIGNVYTDRLDGIDLVYRLQTTKLINLDEKTEINLPSTASRVLYKLFEGVREKSDDVDHAVTPLPDAQRLANQLMRISFHKENICSDLIDLLLNVNDLQVPDSGVVIKHGKHFLNLYESSIFRYLLSTNEIVFVVERLVQGITVQSTQYILSILMRMAERITKQNQRERLTNAVLQHWPSLLQKVSDADEARSAITHQLMLLVTRIAMICPFELDEMSQRADGLEKWLLDIIADSETQMDIKSQAITLLPCIIGPEHSSHETVQQTLEELQAKMPMYSSEYREGTMERAAFENVFLSILKALVASRSPILLRFIINLTAPDTEHIMEKEMAEYVEKVAHIMAENSEHMVGALNIPFCLVASKQQDPSIRISILRRFLLPMIRESSVQAAEVYFSEHIKEIDEWCVADYRGLARNFEIAQALTTRLCGFELMEIMFVIFPEKKLRDKSCSISIALLGTDSSEELIKALGKRAFNAHSERFSNDDPTVVEYFRKYQCAAYRALCAFTCSTQHNVENYEKFLFEERPDSHRFIWKHLIDTSNEVLYTDLTPEVDRMSGVKERFVSIRRIRDDPTPPKYPKLQKVFDSSLSQDVTKTDLSFSMVRTAAAAAQFRYRPAVSIREDNSINDHEVMATLCAVVEHMFESGITLIDDTIEASKAPKWIEWICAIIEDDSVHKNIRLFLATLIDNCRHRFRHFALAVTKAILKLLISDAFNRNMDAFVFVMAVNLLEWDPVYGIQTAEETHLANKLIDNLMRKAWHERLAVFRKNLKLIKHLVEIWRPHICLPHQFLCESIGNSNEAKSKTNLCGLQLNGVVLANQLIPWNETTQIQYLRSLESCLDNDSTQVYSPAAEALGMALELIIVKQESEPADRQFLASLNARLDQLRARNEKKFCDILYSIHSHYTAIVGRYYGNIVNIITHSYGATKQTCLELFLTGISSIERSEVHRELSSIGILELLRSKEYQRQALSIVQGSLPQMNGSEIQTILPDVCAFSSSVDGECRNIMYKILIAVQRTCNEVEINRMASKVLLNGLNETDELRGQILAYWSQHDQLPHSLGDRLEGLLQVMYDPMDERNFVSYCSQLLLEPAIEHIESKSAILKDRNDSGTKYEEYQIDTNWRSQNSSLRAPLFMDSQQRELIDGDISQGFLRNSAAKTSLIFNPTIDPSTMRQESTSFSQRTQSSFLFNDEPRAVIRHSEHFEETSSSVEAKKGSFDHLRTPVLRDKSVISHTIALATIEAKENEKALQKQKEESSASEVRMYRRYRMGEYPDFHVNCLAFLLPLQALVRKDKLLAQQMLITTTQAIFSKLNEDAKRQYMMSIGARIFAIFAQTTQCDSIVFGALMQIAAIDSEAFKVDPDRLITVSNTNKIMANGILLLEDRLRRETSNCSAASDEEQGTWMKLAKMYYNLSEFDIVSGIFVDKLRTDARLPRAIELESMSDYENAKALYVEITNDEDGMIGRDFAYQSLFRCVERMGDWSGLCHDVSDQINEVNELWQDEWNRENLLPHYMRAEMRNLLNGAATTPQYIENVEQWLRDTERGDYIRHNFSECLMMLHLANQDYSEACKHSENHVSRFLTDWNHISVYSNKIRANKILEISKIAEIQKYCGLFSNPEGSNLKELAVRWQRTEMCATDSLEIWESLVGLREFICDFIKGKINSSAPAVRLTKSVIDMRLRLSDIALQQNNVALAKRTLERCIRSDVESERSMQWNLLSGKCLLLESQQTTVGPALDLMVDAWQRNVTTTNLHCELPDTHPHIYINFMEQLAEISESVLDRIGNCEVIDAGIQQRIVELTAPSDKETIVERIYDNVCSGFHKAMQTADKCESVFRTNSGRSDEINGIGEMYNRFAMFYQQYHGIQGIVQSQTNDERIILTSILRGMKFGSANARLQFQSILELPKVVDMQLAGDFEEEMHAVPEWMFITWIPQIMARFTFESPCFLDNLVVRLAKMYPSAILFPFQLAYYEYHHDQERTETDREIVQRILDLLHNPIAKKFIASIECLNLPEQMLRIHLDRIFMNFSKSGYTNDDYRMHLTHTIRSVFQNEYRGTIVQKLHSFKAKLDKLLSLNVDEDRAAIIAVFKDILHKLKDMNTVSISDSVRLETIAPWLQQFQWCLSDESLELPGQYTGASRPNLDRNIKIVRFGSMVKVFRSQRKPIKLSILCSDGNTYDFLTKYGEDLRQDQCVQQMQRLITGRLAIDKNCRAHSLGIETFMVIPISPLCGLLSWVENSQSLDQLEANAKRKEITQQYREFLKRASIGQSEPSSDESLYGEAVARYSPQEIANNYALIASKVPADVLRNVFYQMSASPECFFTLRNNFASSLATMGIANWILGIGDRHLSNLLISKNTGRIVGIDFGMAFGVSTRDQSVPEMIPMRLTPKLIEVISPMDTSGLIKKCMVYTLRAIRAQRKTIMTAMTSVMIDRSRAIQRNHGDPLTETNKHDCIDVINMKLMGANPLHLIASDLKGGRSPRINRYLEGYLKVLMNNSSSRMNEKDLTTEDQVHCLIQLTIDPSILGIAYEGLSPWI